MKLLTECTEKEKYDNDNKLMVKEYSAEMLIGFSNVNCSHAGKSLAKTV
jgi:hypothetical protein